MRIFVLSAFLLLTACGFQPVYGVHSAAPTNIAAQLEEVEIDIIPNYEGQFLRNLLIDRFHRKGNVSNARYMLKIDSVNESQIELDITKTATATRTQMRLSTRLTLIDKRTGTPESVLVRDVQTITSFNILSSEFSTRVTEQSARENALRDLARQIERHVTLFLKQNEA